MLLPKGASYGQAAVKLVRSSVAVGDRLECRQPRLWQRRALLQKLNRDTQKCAFKCSYRVINGKGVRRVGGLAGKVYIGCTACSQVPEWVGFTIFGGAWDGCTIRVWIQLTSCGVHVSMYYYGVYSS